jgi:hypothetical protein
MAMRAWIARLASQVDAHMQVPEGHVCAPEHGSLVPHMQLPPTQRSADVPHEP